jgi:SAM-dependent methyltransferase
MSFASQSSLAPSRGSLWDVSALVYQHTYDTAAHRVDERAIAAVQHVIAGGVVVDAGCGPGVVVPRFVRAGARQVLAVDLSAAMLERVPAVGGVTTVAADLQPGAFENLRHEHGPNGFDLIWFKRSLYHDDATAVALLSDAYASLRVGGRIVVIHPESSLRRYVLDVQADRTRLASYTAYHAFNRLISEVLSRLHVHTYRHRTAAELLAIGLAISPRARLIDTGVSAFNTLLIEREELS